LYFFLKNNLVYPFNSNKIQEQSKKIENYRKLNFIVDVFEINKFIYHNNNLYRDPLKKLYLKLYSVTFL